MTVIAPDGWYDIAKNLPPGLSGALEPGGRENGRGIIPTDFHGLDFEIVDEFETIVEHESCEERGIGEDGTVGWIVDKVLRAWLEGFDFYRHLIISAGRVFWFNPETDPEQATLLVDVWNKEVKSWRETQVRLDSGVRLITYRRVRRWAGNMLRFWALHNPGYPVTTTDKQDECTEIRIWDRESYLPVKIVTVYAFGRVDVRPGPDGKPDAVEFCPGHGPTGLAEESTDAIKALLGRVTGSLEAN